MKENMKVMGLPVIQKDLILKVLSVAAAIAGVFAILVNKIGKIMKIFKNLDHLKKIGRASCRERVLMSV